MLVQPAWITVTCFAGRSLGWMLAALRQIGKRTEVTPVCYPSEQVRSPVSRRTRCLEAVAQAGFHATAGIRGVGNAELRRAEHTADAGDIHVVQYVRRPNVDGEGLGMLGL